MNVNDMTNTILEVIVFVFGIVSVLYARKENILTYPTGLISSGITAYLLFTASYYADMTLNVYFSVMSIYGWFRWCSNQKIESRLLISRTNKREKCIGSFLFFMTVWVTYMIYHAFDYEIKIENSIDILSAGLFFTAMWYMATKKIENWILLIVGDLLVVPIYMYKGLWVLSLQYVLFVVLAISGYKKWREYMALSEI